MRGNDANDLCLSLAAKKSCKSVYLLTCNSKLRQNAQLWQTSSLRATKTTTTRNTRREWPLGRIRMARTYSTAGDLRQTYVLRHEGISSESKLLTYLPESLFACLLVGCLVEQSKLKFDRLAERERERFPFS